MYNFTKEREKKMEKRMISILMAVIMLGMLLTGCGAEKKASSQDQEATETAESVDSQTVTELESGTVELKIWADSGSFDVLNILLDNFKQEYEGQANFEFVIEDKPDSGARDNVLGNVLEAADVFPMADDQLASMVAAGALCPVPNADEIKAANLEGSIDAASINGVLYAYPYSADNGYFLYYNNKFLSETDVQTLDGLMAAAESLGKKVIMQWDSGWYTFAFWGNTGLEFGINDDGVTNYCSWNSTEGAIKGVDVAQAMLDISAKPAFKLGGDTDFTAGMEDDTVVAAITGVWMAADVEKYWGKDYGAVKLPTYTCAGQQIQMSSFKGYKMYGVNYYSKHLGWAQKLAEYLTNEQSQIIRFEMKSQGPSNINASASEAVGKVPAIKAVQDQAEYGVLQKVGNSYWTPTSEFGMIMANGNPNQVDLQELVDNMVNGITKSAAN